MASKRKQIVEKKIQLWKMTNNTYLAPYMSPISEHFSALKTKYGAIKVCFLQNWTLEYAIMQLCCPPIWQDNTLDYNIVNTVSLQKTPSEVKFKTMKFTWNGHEFRYLGSPLCGLCFKEGKLNPETCTIHLHCNHNQDMNKICKESIAKTILGICKD